MNGLPWQISFELVGPLRRRARHGGFTLPRSSGDPVTLLELPGSPFDLHNTRLPNGGPSAVDLARLCELPRMSTAAVAALVNQAVAAMPAGASYVNVGVWRGFTLLAGMMGNPHKRCVGIDDFSSHGGPREALLEDFGRRSTSAHEFHETDYRHYFESLHSGPIAVYCYDGPHFYDDQREGLQLGEPFFADGCIVIVDDTNFPEAHEATLDFIEASSNAYEILLDQPTAELRHPTWWNGLMVLRARKDGARAAPEQRSEATVGEPPEPAVAVDDPLAAYRGRDDESAPRVSLIVRHEGDLEGLSTAVEAALAQTWPNVEVLVADSSGDRLAEALGPFAGEVQVVRASASASAIHECLDASTGCFVAVIGTQKPIHQSAVHISLGFPFAGEFTAPAMDEKTIQRVERSLLAADEIASAVPPGERFAIAPGPPPRPPKTIGSREPIPFPARSRDAGQAATASPLDRLLQLRDSGVRYAAITLPAFGWLERHPEVRDHLEANARELLRTDRVAVFELE